MIKAKTLSCLLAPAALLAAGLNSAFADSYAISDFPTLITPAGRGDAGNLFVGWDNFGTPYTAVNNSTPDLPGSALSGGLITSVGPHISGSGNIYVFMGTETNLTVTAPSTDALGDTGFTTIILQYHTTDGPLNGGLVWGDINGVSPEVVFGTNSSAQGTQITVWNVPGNAASYTFSGLGGPHNSISKLSVDTFWSDTGYKADSFTAIPAAVPEPGVLSLGALSVLGLMRRRRRAA